MTARAARERRSLDAEARFDSLFRIHHRKVLAYCMRRAERADAEEAAADVFAVAWRRLDEVPEGERAVLWLYGVARRTLGNRYRSQRRQRRLREKLGGLNHDVQPAADVVVVQRLEDRLANEALARLREGDREVLRLSLWEELSLAEIAEVLGCSEQAAGQRVSRARRRLRRSWDERKGAGS